MKFQFDFKCSALGNRKRKEVMDSMVASDMVEVTKVLIKEWHIRGWVMKENA